MQNPLPQAIHKTIQAMSLTSMNLMFGISQKMYDSQNLSFSIKFKARAKDGINYIKVKPTSLEASSFDLEFGRVHGLQYKIIKEIKDVYAMALPFIIEVTTELSLTFGGNSPTEKSSIFSALLEAAKTATKDLKFTDEDDENATKRLSESDLANICALALRGVYADLYGSDRTQAVVDLSNRTTNELTVVTTAFGQTLALPQGIENHIAYVLKAGCTAYAEQLYFRAQEDTNFSTDEYGYINDAYYSFSDVHVK